MDIAKFSIPSSPQSPEIWQNLHYGISNFWISVQSLIKVSCHKSRTSDDIRIKLGPKTKLDKKNKIKLANCNVIVNFLIYGQFEAIRKPITKSENRTKESLTQLSTIALSKGTIFAPPKKLFLCKKMLTSAKLRGLLS